MSDDRIAAREFRFADLRIVRSRSAFQVVLESDLANMREFVRLFGVPDQGQEKNIGIVRIQETAAEPVTLPVVEDGGGPIPPCSPPAPIQAIADAGAHPRQDDGRTRSADDLGSPVVRPESALVSFRDGSAKLMHVPPPAVNTGYRRGVPRSPSQRAWLLCQQTDFQRFMAATSSNDAARMMRLMCNISSRSDLDRSAEARARFETLEEDYRAHQRGM